MGYPPDTELTLPYASGRRITWKVRGDNGYFEKVHDVPAPSPSKTSSNAKAKEPQHGTPREGAEESPTEYKFRGWAGEDFDDELARHTRRRKDHVVEVSVDEVEVEPDEAALDALIDSAKKVAYEQNIDPGDNPLQNPPAIGEQPSSPVSWLQDIAGQRKENAPPLVPPRPLTRNTVVVANEARRAAQQAQAARLDNIPPELRMTAGNAGSRGRRSGGIQLGVIEDVYGGSRPSSLGPQFRKGSREAEAGLRKDSREESGGSESKPGNEDDEDEDDLPTPTPSPPKRDKGKGKASHQEPAKGKKSPATQRYEEQRLFESMGLEQGGDGIQTFDEEGEEVSAEEILAEDRLVWENRGKVNEQYQEHLMKRDWPLKPEAEAEVASTSDRPPTPPPRRRSGHKRSRGMTLGGFGPLPAPASEPEVEGEAEAEARESETEAASEGDDETEGACDSRDEVFAQHSQHMT